MENNIQKITVGIYTCFGSPSLVGTAKSIRSAKQGKDVEVIIFADGVPIPGEVKKELEKLEVRIIEKKRLSSQVAKIKNIVFLAGGEIIMLTQDDIIFEKMAISEMEKIFRKKKEITMVGSKIIPVPAETFFESVLEIGTMLVRRIGKKWNNGDNYLLANGRCLSFRAETIKKFYFPEKMTNTDAYFYFENKKLGGKFKFGERSIVYNKSPAILKEHFNQSSRFQASKAELASFFDAEILKGKYEIPIKIIIGEFSRTLFCFPLRAATYLAVSLYTRLKPRKFSAVVNPFWKADESTKRS